jgi:hypothetical protein
MGDELRGIGDGERDVELVGIDTFAGRFERGDG